MNPKQSLLIVIVALIAATALVSAIAYNQSTEIENLTEKNAEVEKSRLDILEKKTNLEVDLAKTKTDITALEKDLVKAKADGTALEKQLSDLKKSSDEAVVALKSDLANMSSTIKKRDERISTLEKDLLEAKIKVLTLTVQMEDYLKQIADLRKQITLLSMPIEQRHLNSSILQMMNCTDCHDQVAAQAAKGESSKYHNKHLNQTNRLLNFKCVDCHKSVDVKAQDLAGVADVATCKKCHTPFRDKVWMGNRSPANDFANMRPNCVDCHKNWKPKMSDATYVNLDNVIEKDCVTCHLKNALYKTEKSPIEIPCSMCHG